jgi:hypothetical protein
LVNISGDRYFQRETVPESLTALGRALCDFYDVPRDSYGIRGNPATHFRGAHRSREFILHSPHCTSRTYTVTETPGNRSGGSDLWCCGLDFAPHDGEALGEMCRRLDDAVRAGRLEKITEWFGSFGGDDVVDGWDNIRDVLATSDRSHLMHLHLTFDRGRAGEDHSDVLDILTGKGTMTASTFDPNTTGLPVRQDVPLDPQIRQNQPKRADGTPDGFPLAWWVQAIRLDTLKGIGALASIATTLGLIVTGLNNLRTEVMAAVSRPDVVAHLEPEQLQQLAELVELGILRRFGDALDSLGNGEPAGPATGQQ